MIEREMFNVNGGVSMTDIEKITIDALAANNVPVAKIAEQVGISRNTIKSYLQRKKAADVCLNCGAVLKHFPHHKKKKFCSDKCRMHYWNTHPQEMALKKAIIIKCEHCGKDVLSYRKKARRYCSRACAVEGRKQNA